MSQGCLAQTLRDGVRAIIDEYHKQVIRLDDMAEEGMTLQVMWVEIQAILRVMRGLCVLATDVDKKEGGQLLSCVLDLTKGSTDRYVLSIFQKLQEFLTRVYLEMLSKWLYEGIVRDRHREFMVEVIG